MIKLVINKGAVIKQLSPEMSGLINAHNHHCTGSLSSPQFSQVSFHKDEIIYVCICSV